MWPTLLHLVWGNTMNAIPGIYLHEKYLRTNAYGLRILPQPQIYTPHLSPCYIEADKYLPLSTETRAHFSSLSLSLDISNREKLQLCVTGHGCKQGPPVPIPACPVRKVLRLKVLRKAFAPEEPLPVRIDNTGLPGSGM